MSDKKNFGNTTSTKNQSLKGSSKDENFLDGYGSDTIHTIGGTNTVSLGRGGLNKIYSEGDDEITFSPKSYVNYIATGGDIIYNSNSSDKLFIDKPSIDTTQFAKSGNDLVVVQNGQSGIGAGKVTVKNYFDAEEKINIKTSDSYNVLFNEEKNKMVYGSSSEFDIYNLVEGKNTVKGTENSDIIIANAKSTITTGNGDDIIYTSSAVDTINIDGEGTKTIIVRPDSGNDIVNIKNADAQIKIDLCQSDYRKPTYSRIGNDLKLSYTGYIWNTKKNIRENGKTATLTIKDYFENEYKIAIRDPYFDESSFTKISNDINYIGMTIAGNPKKANALVGTDYYDVITGGDKADKITTGKGNDTITLGKGDDTVIIDGEGTKTINVKAGDGTLTVEGVGNSTSTNIKFEEISYGGYGENVDGKYVAWSQENDDLIIHYINNSNLKEDTVTIKNLSEEDKTKLKINDYGLSNYRGFVSGNDIDDSDKESENVLWGTDKNDTIVSTNSYNYVYSGAGNDTITISGSRTMVASGTGNDTINIKDEGYYRYIHAGAGNDTINVDGSAYIYSGEGNDTINLTKNAHPEVYFVAGNGSDTITFSNDFAPSSSTCFYLMKYKSTNYYKSGDDLLLKCSYQNSKNKMITETHTLKGFFKLSDEQISKLEVSYNKYSSSSITKKLNDVGVNISGKYNKTLKATEFVGTDYKDKVTGTAKADYINTGGGNDIINAGKGNDVINAGDGNDTIDAGDGNDTIIVGNGKDTITAGKGNDTITIEGSGTKNIKIANGDGNDTITFTETSTGTANLVMSGQDIFMVDKENNAITRIYDSNGKIIKETTTINNPGSQKVQINGTDISEFKLSSIQTLNAKKANEETVLENNVVIGGAKADKITLESESSAVFAGAGNDEITVLSGDSTIIGGKGNDTINLNTTGKVNINHATGDGNDTITFDKKPSDLTINVDFKYSGKNIYEYYSAYMYSAQSGQKGFKKSDKDLIISIPAGGKKAETITIKDYFADSNSDLGKSIKISGSAYANGTVEDLFESWGIWADSVYNDETKITTYDAIMGYDNYFNYKGSGKTVINGGDERNTYYATLGAKSDLYINDANDGYDYLSLNANYKNVKAFFNISRNGDIIISTGDYADYSDDFMIFNKGSMTASNIKNALQGKGKGVIDINGFFEKDNSIAPEADGSSIATDGDGYMSRITVSNDTFGNLYNYYKGGYKKIGNIRTESWINAVTEKVSAWLNKNDFNTAFDVIENGSDKDINAMLKVYQSVNNGAVFNKELEM